MTTSGFKVSIDPGRNHLRLTYSGFMDTAMLAPLERELDAAFDRLAAAPGGPGSHLVLIDLREQDVQSQSVVAGLLAIAARYGTLSRRVAIVVPGSHTLHKMQVRRVVPKGAHVLFQNEAEALSWLFSLEDTLA